MKKAILTALIIGLMGLITTGCSMSKEERKQRRVEIDNKYDILEIRQKDKCKKALGKIEEEKSSKLQNVSSGAEQYKTNKLYNGKIDKIKNDCDDESSQLGDDKQKEINQLRKEYES